MLDNKYAHLIGKKLIYLYRTTLKRLSNLILQLKLLTFKNQISLKSFRKKLNDIFHRNDFISAYSPFFFYHFGKN